MCECNIMLLKVQTAILCECSKCMLGVCICGVCIFALCIFVGNWEGGLMAFMSRARKVAAKICKETRN